jgi:hypothetical protein
MNIKTQILDNIKILYNLSFKTRCYRKNFDLIVEDEHIITEYEGNIGVLQIKNQKPPVVIGEFGFSMWNIDLAKMLDIDLDTLINRYSDEDTYNNLKTVINDGLFNINKYKKIVFIHSLILKNDYKKKNITEEFIEMIYRDFYDKDTAIIALAKPFQTNKVFENFYLNIQTVKYLQKTGDTQNMKRIPASAYYSIRDLYNKNDDEYNEYKIFALAQRLGFTRIGNSYLFEYNPNKTVERLKVKSKIYKEIIKK